MATRKTTAKTAAKPNVSPEELLEYYREMLLIRRFEEKAGQLYGMGQIGGFCGTPVRTAENLVGSITQSPKAVGDRQGALHSAQRQGAIRMVLPMVPFSSNAMTEQKEINRIGGGHADAGCSTHHSDLMLSLVLQPA